jgi:hypothetical protein
MKNFNFIILFFKLLLKVLDKSIFGFFLAIMRQIDYNFRIHNNFCWKKDLHHIFLIKQLDRSELPN